MTLILRRSRSRSLTCANGTELLIRKPIGLRLEKAYKYLGDVKEHNQIIPFRRFSGGVGRASQAKQFKATQGRWPKKSVKIILDLLKNAESNAGAKNLELNELIIKPIVVRLR